MLREIAVSIIGSLLIAGNIGAAIGIAHITDQTKDFIDKTWNAIKEGEKQTAVLTSKQAAAYWETNENILILFVDHDSIDVLNKSLAVLPILIEQADDTAVQTTSEEIQKALEQVKKAQFPLLENIL